TKESICLQGNQIQNLSLVPLRFAHKMLQRLFVCFRYFFRYPLHIALFFVSLNQTLQILIGNILPTACSSLERGRKTFAKTRKALRYALE
ncbi:MAG: hypothetical protein BECKG1743E_GA0114224_107322, partial [Candidatus Kentron sp. G]